MAFSIVVKLSLLSLLIAFPFVTNSYSAYQLGLYLLYGIVGQGIALCWGKGGFLPLGQALFFGIGAYISGLMLQNDVGWGLVIVTLSLAIVIPFLLAGVVGVLVFNRQIGSGPYFSLITLALALVGFQLANSQVWLTGGFNGLTGINGLPNIDSFGSLYFVIVGALFLTTIILSKIMGSPFGLLLEAVRENEERLQFLGNNTSWIKAAAFAISGGIAGLAGAFFAPHQGIVTPQVLGFILSAELVIWTAVGGRFGLLGPVIGAVLIGFLASGLRDAFVYWEVIVAFVFILVVLRLPGGIGAIGVHLSRKIGLNFHSYGEISERSRSVPEVDKIITRELKFEEVTITRGSVVILDKLSFKIEGLGIQCLIGPNGAGKTSALNALTGKLEVDSGEISWCGRSLNNVRPFQTLSLGIGRKFQVPSIFPNLTIRQNIDLSLWVNRLKRNQLLSMVPYTWKSDLLEKLEEVFPFISDKSLIAGSLSVGERQMLDFTMTVLSEPSLVLLDEPCAGLSKAETETMIKAIADLSKSSKSMFIIVEHDMQVVELLSDNVLVMHQGKLIAQGSLAEIRSNKDVQRVYAGGTK